ncbi:ABC transporter ATP-binding protein [Clostridium sp. 'deep sea']|uniref:ABC transporter ATP-binding protein n=1 Tax=Clostridium sp. 'deep sea' TaxID=2779445 RepID=UPI00189666A5|nr:ABC transporter ATP-binding protein [Clostridium sp. 'deep sea']QOR35224.1 ABC transporter ATP-binding protein [Clostridium sp. 'deep sea']
MLKILKMISNNNNSKLYQISFISTLEALLGAVPFCVLYFILSSIIDNNFTLAKAHTYVLAIVVSVVLRAIVSFFSINFVRKSGAMMIRDLRLRVGEHIRKLSLGFFNNNDIGSLSNKTLECINRLEMLITIFLTELVSTFVLTIFVSIVLAFIDIKLVWTVLITIPIAFVMLIISRRVMGLHGSELYESSNRLSDGLLEFIQGIKYIKSFNNSSKKFDDLTEKMNDFKVKSLNIEGNLSPIMVLTGIAIDFGLVLLILVGAYQMIGGALSAKTLIIFMIISSKYFENLKTLAINSIKIKYLTIAGNSVQSILNEKVLDGTKTDVDFSNHDIVFNNVNFSYKSTSVLKGINLSIKENTLTAFVGPSGSGKTTMTHLIARFFDTNSGDIKIGGLKIKELDADRLLQEISMVFQNVILFRDTIYNNILIGRSNATYKEVIEAAKKSNCHDFISKLPQGYDTIVGENGSTLSGGEQQRISIARAILKDAPIVLLDEATASLDPENEIFIQNAISELLKNKTIIVIAHRLKTIKNADQIVVFDNGTIREKGTHAELLSYKQKYYTMWRTQQNAIGWQVDN